MILNNIIMDKMDFHKRIRQARIDSHISQIKMAKMLYISRQTYIDIENGIRVPKADTIYKIAIITNHSVGYFFYDNYQLGDIHQIGFLLEQLPNEKRKWYLKLLKKIIEYECT
ncbi:XRE family transcriptional regulator [Photobacterium kishitanii]|uniref:XRE family transcriptional regulator n=3 Tax=Photobacterium kishitanii TaxID=318456 RepID=A0AAX0YYP3_9GAMM|nr:XRE family transcriptional regulator [Photobacterium kishitanii]PSX29442.1 XRE family transcriptional regulator [Photobacterium kishitanii]PSX33952.1 XRE family transcriptional regulator [Photobacterium kishitanii]PSX45891.1 XRE family transcriptional regulator [Photobacterium kishitanii]